MTKYTKFRKVEILNELAKVDTLKAQEIMQEHGLSMEELRTWAAHYGKMGVKGLGAKVVRGKERV